MKIVQLACAFLASAVFAQSAGNVHNALKAEAVRLEAWTKDAELVEAVTAQNALNVPLDEIAKIDRRWQNGDVREEVMTSPCAVRLRQLMRQRDYYIEAFVSDNRGALVCASARTSDYWQGDESKWLRAFNEGRGAVFIDRPRFDESAQAMLGVISLPIRDKDAVIGVVTIGVLADKLPPAK